LSAQRSLVGPKLFSNDHMPHLYRVFPLQFTYFVVFLRHSLWPVLKPRYIFSVVILSASPNEQLSFFLFFRFSLPFSPTRRGFCVLILSFSRCPPFQIHLPSFFTTRPETCHPFVPCSKGPLRVLSSFLFLSRDPFDPS